MKKVNLLLLLLSFTIIISCNKDDDSSDNNQQTNPPLDQLTFEIDGEIYDFDTYEVSEGTGNGLVFTEVNATMSNSTSQTLEMGFIKNETGNGSFQYFIYNLNGMNCSSSGGDMNYNFSTNNSSEIIGTFSGSVDCNDSDIKVISDGEINISY